MKIGIIREGKTPPDSRVPLVPAHCSSIIKDTAFDLVVEPSSNRCFSDDEYLAHNIPINTSIEDCDILLGVKEVPIDQLIPNKTYCFFSHTIKKQAYNRQLLLAILEKNIRLIDYEVMTNEKGQRLIAFGRFAGMVGAHNAIWTYGQRTGQYQLKRMKDCKDYAEAKASYQALQLPPVKIVLTGTGRVGSGAAEVLRDMGIREIHPEEFLTFSFSEPVFTQLACHHYAARKDGSTFDKKDFYKNPQLYKSIFSPFIRVSDIMINGIYWDNQAPAFFTKEEMQDHTFNIKVIADVTCDIAPVSSIPSTLKASTIADPVFGFDPKTGSEGIAFRDDVIDMMTIDNLPNELPRDASTAFGDQFIAHILPEFLNSKSEILNRATVAVKGQLGPHFQYLQDYVSGEAAK